MFLDRYRGGGGKGNGRKEETSSVVCKLEDEVAKW